MFDTNILTAFRDEENRAHRRVLAFAAEQWQDGILVAPQSLYEYYAVASRPKDVNGLGRSPEDAARDVLRFRQSFTVLPDPPNLLDAWLELCREHGVSGKPAHDARLAAYARLHGIVTLVTLNARDFRPLRSERRRSIRTRPRASPCGAIRR